MPSIFRTNNKTPALQEAAVDGEGGKSSLLAEVLSRHWQPVPLSGVYRVAGKRSAIHLVQPEARGRRSSVLDGNG